MQKSAKAFRVSFTASEFPFEILDAGIEKRSRDHPLSHE
jgi:hypothetical protein